MQSNGKDRVAKATQSSAATNLAAANGIIVARVCELLCSRQGTILESPDGNCVAIYLHALQPNNVAEEESSIQKCGN